MIGSCPIQSPNSNNSDSNFRRIFGLLIGLDLQPPALIGCVTNGSRFNPGAVLRSRWQPFARTPVSGPFAPEVNVPHAPRVEITIEAFKTQPLVNHVRLILMVTCVRVKTREGPSLSGDGDGLLRAFHSSRFSFNLPQWIPSDRNRPALCRASSPAACRRAHEAMGLDLPQP
jgi:hypothetical protein